MPSQKNNYDNERLFILEAIKELRKAIEKFSQDVVDLKIAMGRMIALYAVASAVFVTILVKAIERIL